MYKFHSTCRACGYGAPGLPYIKSGAANRLIPVFDLGVQPLANDFKTDDEEHTGYAPLKVLHCPKCSLAQLSVTVDPKIIYSKYPYVTSPSGMMRRHFDTLISDIRQEVPSAKSVMEIGSNDGKLLDVMRDKGFTVEGIDPAGNLAYIANSNGIKTNVMLFNSEAVRGFPTYDVIIARHVFCHVDNWEDFMLGLQVISHKNTLICIETPYLGDLLENCEFDTIYHEHLSYLPVKAMVSLLARTGFRMRRIIKYSIHGGAYLWMIVREDSPLNNGFTDVPEEITVEKWDVFNKRARLQISELRKLVKDVVASGDRVAGLGASAKSTVWINACGLTKADISFIADTTSEKHYKFTPGTDIPIVDEGAILRELPDYVIMWAWNYKDEILEKFQMARSKGVHFIIPVPTIDIV